MTQLHFETLKLPKRPTERASFRCVDSDGKLFALIHTKFLDADLSALSTIVLNASGDPIIPMGQQFQQNILSDQQEYLQDFKQVEGLEVLLKSAALQGLIAGTHVTVKLPNAGLDATNDALSKIMRKRRHTPVITDDLPNLTLDHAVPHVLLKTMESSIGASSDLIEKPPLSGFVTYGLVKDHPAFQKAQNLDIGIAKTCLQACPSPSSAAVSYYGDTRHFAHTYRVQAAQSLPLLADLFARTAVFRNTIDLQKSLNPSLEEKYGFSKGILKRLRKVTSSPENKRLHSIYERATGFDALGVMRERSRGITGLVSIEQSLEILKKLPPDWAPGSNEEWAAYTDVLTSMAVPLERSYGLAVEQTLKASKGKWVDFKNTLARAAGYPPETFTREQMAAAMADSLEGLRAFSHDVVLPLGLTSVSSVGVDLPSPTHFMFEASDKAALEVVLDKSKNKISNLLEFGRSFIAVQTRLSQIDRGDELERSAEILARYDVSGWPAISDDFTTSKGFQIEVIKNQTTAEHVGTQLNNCIGGYLQKCKSGTAHIMMIKSPRGTICSAFEIIGKSSGANEANWRLNPMLKQHQAYGNANLYGPKYSDSEFSSRDGETKEDLVAACEEYLLAWKEGSLPLHIQEVNSFQDAIKRQKGQMSAKNVWHTHLGWDVHNDTIRNAFWGDWKTCLGSRVSSANNPGVLFKFKAVQDVVHTISPQAGEILQSRSQQAGPVPPRESRNAELSPGL